MNVTTLDFILNTIDHTSQHNVPGFLWRAIGIIHKVHKGWRTYQRVKPYTDPDNYLGLGFAKAISSLPFLHICAHAVVISNRIMKCVVQKNKIGNTWRKFTQALTSKYIIFPKRTWHHKAGDWKRNALYARITLIFILIIEMFCRIFVFSMLVLDAREGFYLNSENRGARMEEACVEGVDALLKNKHLILKGLEENKELVERLLCVIHPNYQADRLIEKIEYGLEKTEKFRKTMRKKTKHFRKGAAEAARHVAFGAAATVGMESLLPVSWVPSRDFMKEKNGAGEGEEFCRVKFLPVQLAVRPTLFKGMFGGTKNAEARRRGDAEAASSQKHIEIKGKQFFKILSGDQKKIY